MLTRAPAARAADSDDAHLISNADYGIISTTLKGGQDHAREDHQKDPGVQGPPRRGA